MTFSVHSGYLMVKYHQALQRASLQLVDLDALRPDGKGTVNDAVKQAGRPRKRRIRSQCEGRENPPKEQRCGGCGEVGHNKRSCPSLGN